MKNNMKDIKIKCIETIEPFIKGKEYLTDNRCFKNKNDENDLQILIVESVADNDLLNCYLVSLDKVSKHFILI